MKIKMIKYNKDFIIYYKNKKPSQKLIDMSIYFLKNDINNKNILIKKGNGRKIYKTYIDSEGFFLKKYSYRSFNKKLKNIFRKSAAYNALKISHRLLNNNIPVVKPVFSIVFKHNLWKYDSIFITKEYKSINLQQFLIKNNYSIKLKRKLLKKSAKIYAKMYNNNFINGDPNLPGILINKKNKLFLVDVDNIKMDNFLTDKKIITNLANFNAHSYSGLGNMNKKKLSTNDRKLFFISLINKYNFKENNKNLLCKKIRKKTKKILFDWGKEYLIINF